MKKINFVEGKTYIYKNPGYPDLEVQFECEGDNGNRTCNLCGKERWYTFEFVTGSFSNPTSRYCFGSECVKKCIYEKIEITD